MCRRNIAHRGGRDRGGSPNWSAILHYYSSPKSGKNGGGEESEKIENKGKKMECPNFKLQRLPNGDFWFLVFFLDGWMHR